MILVFLIWNESPRRRRSSFNCLKSFCCVGKNGTVIGILKVYNGSYFHLWIGLETTQVEKFPNEPI